jgi:hypothetical protein
VSTSEKSPKSAWIRAAIMLAKHYGTWEGTLCDFVNIVPTFGREGMVITYQKSWPKNGTRLGALINNWSVLYARQNYGVNIELISGPKKRMRIHMVDNTDIPSTPPVDNESVNSQSPDRQEYIEQKHHDSGRHYTRTQNTRFASVKEWLLERAMITPEGNALCWEMHEDYVAWAGPKAKPLGINPFGKMLKALTGIASLKSNRGQFYPGIQLVQATQKVDHFVVKDIHKSEEKENPSIQTWTDENKLSKDKVTVVTSPPKEVNATPGIVSVDIGPDHVVRAEVPLGSSMTIAFTGSGEKTTVTVTTKGPES